MPPRRDLNATTITVDPFMDPQNSLSPYYIGSREHTTDALVSSKLEGPGNYHPWSRLMRKALITKNKYKFVDGTILAPTDDFNPLYEPFERCNNLVHSWIVNYVNSSIGQSILYVENASKVWKVLKQRFSQGDTMRVAELHKELYQSKQGDLSVTEFFTNLSTIWEELDNFRPALECKYRIKCSCDAINDVLKHKEDDRVIRFITGLNDNFSLVQNQILLLDPLPSSDRAFSMEVQFERQNGLCMSSEETEL